PFPRAWSSRNAAEITSCWARSCARVRSWFTRRNVRTMALVAFADGAESVPQAARIAAQLASVRASSTVLRRPTGGRLPGSARRFSLARWLQQRGSPVFGSGWVPVVLPQGRPAFVIALQGGVV